MIQIKSIPVLLKLELSVSWKLVEKEHIKTHTILRKNGNEKKQDIQYATYHNVETNERKDVPLKTLRSYWEV